MNKEDKNTRYVVDINTKTLKIASWHYDHKEKLAQKLEDPNLHRVFLTKGQYHKLVNKLAGINRE